VLGGDPDGRWLLASDAGYGFVCTLSDLQAKARAGKAVLTLPSGARVLGPVQVPGSSADLVVAATSSGHLLAFLCSELPELNRGKGNKIIGIPSARAQAREEIVLAIVVLPAGASLAVLSGKRTLTLKPDDLQHYVGERGRRGGMLPRGFQRVDGLRAA
jgi:topoisomerase-4 subunit A